VRITPSHHRTLTQHGHVLVPGFLTQRELRSARANLLRCYPAPDELEKTPERYGGILEDPEQLQNEFPFAGDALNHISMHPDLIAFVERALETKEVLLSQAAIWAKYAGTGDFEQGLHLDYQGNTLVVPRDDGAYRQVNMILYYTDVGPDLGPTFVVSQEKTKSLGLWPTFRTRTSNPNLYKHERPILAKAGDLLIFSMRTWHRASAITADRGVRLSHHLVWRSAQFPFQGYHQWSSKGENPLLQNFIPRTTPRQREVLGFPKIADPYWTQETLAAVALRYPQMNLAPYRKGAKV